MVHSPALGGPLPSCPFLLCSLGHQGKLGGGWQARGKRSSGAPSAASIRFRAYGVAAERSRAARWLGKGVCLVPAWPGQACLRRNGGGGGPRGTATLLLVVVVSRLGRALRLLHPPAWRPPSQA